MCGSRRLIDYLVNHARPYIFSTALAPPLAAAADAAVAVVEEEPERRRRLLALASLLVSRLRRHRLQRGADAAHIVPILIGGCRRPRSICRHACGSGACWSPPSGRPPSPRGTARLRISLTAGHTEEDVAALVEGLRKEFSA